MQNVVLVEFVLSVKVFGGHSWQVVEPSESDQKPKPHDEQKALPSFYDIVPEGHLTQTLLDDAPEISLYSPGLHFWQTDLSVAPILSLQEPAGHSEQYSTDLPPSSSR